MPAKTVNPDKLTLNRGTWDKLSRALKLEGLVSQTIDNYYWVLRDLDTLGIDAKRLNKAGAEKAVEFWQEKMGVNTATVRRAILKKIAKLLDGREFGKGEYPEAVKWISTTRSKKRRLPKVLTKEKIRKLVDAADTQRDRALLFTLYESGMRAREFLSLAVGDVTFDKYGAVFRLVEREGSRLKTGERRVRLFESVPDLQLWVNLHPQKNDPEAPLWITRGPNASGRMVINSLDELVRKYSERAGIGPVYPHLLRHSRATILANVLTESQMNAVLGWVQGSNMPAVYVHLSGRDVDRALLKAHGIKEGSEEAREEDSALKPITCPRCQVVNPAGFKFCGKCSMVLTAAGMEIVETEKDELIKRVDKLGGESQVAGAEAALSRAILEAITENPELLGKIKEKLTTSS